jgi:hypothetical protein
MEPKARSREWINQMGDIVVGPWRPPELTFDEFSSHLEDHKPDTEATQGIVYIRQIFLEDDDIAPDQYYRIILFLSKINEPISSLLTISRFLSTTARSSCYSLLNSLCHFATLTEELTLLVGTVSQPLSQPTLYRRHEIQHKLGVLAQNSQDIQQDIDQLLE